MLSSSSQSMCSSGRDLGFSFFSPVPSTSSSRRLSERSSLSSYTSQSSRNSSDTDSYLELQNIAPNMDRSEMIGRHDVSHQVKTRSIFPNKDFNTASTSSAFQPFVNTKHDLEQHPDNFQQTQNLLNNVKSIAESLAKSTAKRALTFSSDRGLTNEDILRYRFDRADLYSPRTGQASPCSFVNGKSDFKPIVTTDKTSITLPHPQDCGTMQRKSQPGSFVSHKTEPLRIVTQTPSTCGIPSAQSSSFAWSNPSTPGSVALSSNSSMASEVPGFDSTCDVVKHVLQSSSSKPLQYVPTVHTNTENMSSQTVLKQSVPTTQFYAVQGRHDLPGIKNEKLPQDLLGGQIMLETPQLLTTVQQPQLLKYPAPKVPVMLPPGTLLQQPFIPPEGFDLVAIDAFGRMMPVQYTDLAYQMPPGYVLGYPPFLPTFRQQR